MLKKRLSKLIFKKLIYMNRKYNSLYILRMSLKIKMILIFKGLIFKLFTILFSFYPINSQNLVAFNIINAKNKKDKTIRKLDEEKKNLLIGIIINYSWEKIKVYFISLMKAEFENCDFVMFTKNIPEETLKNLNLYRVTTYPVPEQYLSSRYAISSYRWKIYEEFLLKNKDKYNMVFTLDIRDSFFQKDIFQYFDYNKPFLGVFFEDGNLTENINKNWLKKFLNEKDFNKIANESVICAGAVIATTDKFIELAQAEWEILKDRRDINDQSLLNYLIYHKKFMNDCLIKKDCNSGPLVTVGISKREMIFDKDDNMLTFNGDIAAAIHQYDRRKNIIQKMAKKFSDENFNISEYFQKKEDEIKHKKNTIKIKSIIKRIIFIFIIVAIILLLFFFIKKKEKYFKKKTKFKKVKIKFQILENSKKSRIKFKKLRNLF